MLLAVPDEIQYKRLLRERVSKYELQGGQCSVGCSYHLDLFRRIVEIIWKTMLTAKVEPRLVDANELLQGPNCTISPAASISFNQQLLACLCSFSSDCNPSYNQTSM